MDEPCLYREHDCGLVAVSVSIHGLGSWICLGCVGCTDVWFSLPIELWIGIPVSFVSKMGGGFSWGVVSDG